MISMTNNNNNNSSNVNLQKKKANLCYINLKKMYKESPIETIMSPLNRICRPLEIFHPAGHN